MYSFFYDMLTRVSTNNLDSGATNSTFHVGGVVLTNAAADSKIAHTPWKKRKQIKERAGKEERSQTE